MKFEFEGTAYDVRLKKRYLPKPFKEISGEDLMILMSSRALEVVKQKIMDKYAPGAKIL